jgi:hypothetical protein
VSIYFLICPISKTIRYVGVTNDPKRRLEDHCQAGQANPRMRAWIDGLVRLGTRPEMVIVGKVAGSGWEAAERAWIKWFRCRHCGLYNIHRGGMPSKVEVAQRTNGLTKAEAVALHPKARVHGAINKLGVYHRNVVVPLSLPKRKARNKVRRAIAQRQAAKGEKLQVPAPQGAFTLRGLNDEVKAERVFREQLKRRATGR